MKVLIIQCLNEIQNLRLILKHLKSKNKIFTHTIIFVGDLKNLQHVQILTFDRGVE